MADTSKFSPTNRLNPIPAPPPTINVPVPELVAFVVSNNLTLPASIPVRVPLNASEELVALCQSANLEAVFLAQQLAKLVSS